MKGALHKLRDVGVRKKAPVEQSVPKLKGVNIFLRTNIMNFSQLRFENLISMNRCSKRFWQIIFKSHFPSDAIRIFHLPCHQCMHNFILIYISIFIALNRTNKRQIKSTKGGFLYFMWQTFPCKSCTWLKCVCVNEIITLHSKYKKVCYLKFGHILQRGIRVKS